MSGLHRRLNAWMHSPWEESRVVTRKFFKWLPAVLRDRKFMTTVFCLWVGTGLYYFGLHSLIYVGGVAYRWLYVLLFLIFLFSGAVIMLKKAPERESLRRKFEIPNLR